MSSNNAAKARLVRFAQATRADCAGILVAQPSGEQLLISHGHSEESIAAYMGHYANLDPLGDILRSHLQATFITCDAYVHPAYQNAELQNDYLQRFKIRHLAAAHWTDHLGVLHLIGFQRLEDSPPFSREDINFLDNYLGRELREDRARAVLHQATGNSDGHNLTGAVLDHLRTPMLVLDANLGVHYANRAATKKLEGCTHLRLKAGHLVATDRRTDRLLRAALARMLEDLHPTTLSLDPLHPHKLASFVPFTHPQMSGVLMLWPDEELQTNNRSLWKQMYQLTDAELNLATALASGWRLQDYAESHRLQLSTVKSYLKSIFSKTDTNRQADLVRLLHKLHIAMR